MPNYFWTLQELRQKLYTKYPGMAQIPWIDDRLRAMWNDAVPHPQTWDRRMIAPSVWAKFAHEAAQRIGQDVTAKPSGG